MFFSKKINPGSEAEVSPTDFKLVTENLYKQNLELAVKNKTLSLLSKLYEISIETLEPKDLAKKITTVIQGDFNFELVGVFLYDKSIDTLAPLSFTESERFHTAETLFDNSLYSVSITGISQKIFYGKMLKEKEMVYTENLEDIWDSLVPAEVLEKLKTDARALSSILYPLVIENE